MIIKDIFKIHFFFYIVTFIALFTGHIIDYLFFVSILLVHEFGHVFGGMLFGFKVKKFIILPFGGFIIFDNLINTPLFYSFIITILGPVFQILYFILLNKFFVLSHTIIYYNFFLLIFNLLPIFPLDGSKFLDVFLNSFFCFKTSFFVKLVISFIFLFVVTLFFHSFFIYLVVPFLFIKTYLEFKNRRYIYNRFLYERYVYDFNFKRLKYINSPNHLYMSRRHMILYDKNYITERNYLMKRFDKHINL